MALSDLLFLRRFRLGIYSFTGLLVLILGGILYGTLGLGDGVQIEMATRPTSSNKTSSVAARGLASVPQKSLAQYRNVDVLPTLEVDCSDASQRPAVRQKSPYLRLRAKGCEPLAIENKANDFRATLFQMEDQTYVTDYISLAPGSNELVLRRKSDSDTVPDLRLNILVVN